MLAILRLKIFFETIMKIPINDFETTTIKRGHKKKLRHLLATEMILVVY